MVDQSVSVWLQKWLFYSLKLQLSEQGSGYEHLKKLSQVRPSTPCIIGISGAQGSGKSTLAARLQQMWLGLGVQTEVISLDDYYLEPAERAQRAKLWHPLFAERGVPGTHDITALYTQLQGFKRAEAQQWRRYDKGRDAAAVYSEKTTASLLILEGWCVGITAQTESELLHNPNPLEQQQDPDAVWRRTVNRHLAEHYQQVWQLMDQLIWLDAPDWNAVCRWRAWQELPLQQVGLGKSPAELAHFMLYFERLTRQSWQQLPARADFIVQLGQDHQLTAITPDEWADR